METSTGNTDSYTVKYSPGGDLLWANTYAGSPTGLDYGYALAVDQNGNAYVGGFGNGDNPTFDIFVLKYSNTGDVVWTQRCSRNTLASSRKGDERGGCAGSRACRDN
jgi:hypothetical protein